MNNNPQNKSFDNLISSGQSTSTPKDTETLKKLQLLKAKLTNNNSQEQRIAAVREALKFGFEGIKLVTPIIQTETGIVQWTAHNLLWEKATEKQKEELLQYPRSVALPELVNQGMKKRLGRGFITDIIPLKNNLILVCSAGGATLFHIGLSENILWEIDCPARCGAINSRHNLLAIGADPNIYLWNLRTGQLLAELKGHISPINNVAFSPDGKILASGSWDETVRLWDVASGKQIQVLQENIKRVETVAFSQDGKILASGSWDETIRLWDVATGK
ncbi:MAG: hypothetical protein F6K24_33725, partial [Okeania sp. SIO2D1]|nr:hypothetical protein [Okeania sp. SIO2D1]